MVSSPAICETCFGNVLVSKSPLHFLASSDSYSRRVNNLDVILRVGPFKDSGFVSISFRVVPALRSSMKCRFSVHGPSFFEFLPMLMSVQGLQQRTRKSNIVPPLFVLPTSETSLAVHEMRDLNLCHVIRLQSWEIHGLTRFFPDGFCARSKEEVSKHARGESERVKTGIVQMGTYHC